MKKKNRVADHSILPWLTRCVIALLAGIGMTASAQTPIWSEEFNYLSAPDGDVWSYDLGAGGWGNSELQSYTNDSDNVWVNGSNLVITARRSGNSFTSARIKTQEKLTFKYGTIEARIQTPDLENGLWPAFWTLGNNYSSVDWPACGEIDVMEMGNSGAIAAGVINKRVGSAAHWENGGGYAGYWSGMEGAPLHDRLTDIDGTFVTYRMEWTPWSIKTYIDDDWIWTMSISGGAGSDLEEFHEPHFMILNLAVGGTYTGIYGAGGITALASGESAEYKVDWIRIYDNGYTELGGTSTVKPPSPEVNLLENPGFESGTTGWSSSLSGASASSSSAYARSGTASLEINSTGAGGWASPNLSQSFSASEGNVFNLQGYLLNPAGTPVTGGSFGLFKIEFRDSSGDLIVPEPGSVEIGYLQSNPGYPGAESRPLLNASSATDAWIFSEVQAEAPPGTATVGFYLLNVNDPGNLGPMYYDDIQAMLIGHPVSLSASVMGGDIYLSFPTENGVSYYVMDNSSLTNGNWNALETVDGDGNTNTVSYPTSDPACFYQVLTP